MLKKLLTAFTAATLIAGALAVPTAAKGETRKIAYGSAKIDGKLEAAYKSSEPVEVKYSNDASYSTAKVYLLWDEGALYLYADVTDDTPSTKANTSNVADIWKTDCIEWGLNLNPADSGDNHKMPKAGIWLASPQYGKDKMDIKGEINKSATTEAAIGTTATGWYVEAKLNVFGAKTGITPEAGSKYQFFSHLHNDTNDDNNRDTATYMNSDLSLCATTSANMDFIELAAKPAVKPAPATADASSLVFAAMAAAAAGFVATKKK